jgi:predicted aldo/keto reductase-like oxidoreductase
MPTATEEESFKILNEFAARGGNFIDTANVYGQGDSEEVLGRYIIEMIVMEAIQNVQLSHQCRMIILFLNANSDADIAIYYYISEI